MPKSLADSIIEGGRVVVQFGRRKIYTALVTSLHQNNPDGRDPKEILSVLDESPVLAPLQLRFWNWISSYYLCHPGEVMNAALPSALKLTSESRVRLDPAFDYSSQDLNEREDLLVMALHNRPFIEVSEVSKILGLLFIKAYPMRQSILCFIIWAIPPTKITRFNFRAWVG